MWGNHKWTFVLRSGLSSLAVFPKVLLEGFSSFAMELGLLIWRVGKGCHDQIENLSWSAILWAGKRWELSSRWNVSHNSCVTTESWLQVCLLFLTRAQRFLSTLFVDIFPSPRGVWYIIGTQKMLVNKQTNPFLPKYQGTSFCLIN